jgi:hypothetical protein
VSPVLRNNSVGHHAAFFSSQYFLVRAAKNRC